MKKKMSRPSDSGLFEGLVPSVALSSLLIVLAIAASAAIFNEPFDAALAGAREAVTPFLESYYIVLVSIILIFVIWLGVGRYKNVRLGGDDETPEFSTFSWITMLFAAGMGVGLIFWSVAEPISHLQENPFMQHDAGRAPADVAMRLTFFHWGLHGWALFSFVAIVIGYFGFRYKLPLTMRSALFPILRQRIFGPVGDVMDIFTVVATLFGIVTTVGLGVQQLNAGLEALFGIATASRVQILVSVIVMTIATSALLAGLDNGLRLLSETNFWLSVLLVGIFLSLGPTTYLLALAAQTTGDYLQNLVFQSFWTAANEPSDWHGQWTVFYWGWWMAWAPFVGLFVARISRGRKLREFVMGVLLAPVIISFVWLAVLGGTGLHLEQTADAGIANVMQVNVATAFYHTVDVLSSGHVGLAIAVLVTILIAIYLITSASAGVLVVNTLLAFGGTRHKRRHQIAWGAIIAALTAALLVAGGIETLQNAVIMASLPFSVGLIAMMVGLVWALEEEVYGPVRGDRSVLPSEPWTQTGP